MNSNGFDVLDPSECAPDLSPAAGIVANGYAVQQMRSNYATAVAVQKPRDLAIAQRQLGREAQLAGEDFYYGWAAGRDRIEGPSVNLALAAARCWGNCAVEPLPVQDLGDSWIFTAAFVDLETGFTLSRQFRQSKNSKVSGKMDEERKADIRFQIGQSKAIRNVVLNALPPSLIRHALEEAQQGVRVKIEAYIKAKGLPAAVDIVLKALAKFGVKEEYILQRFNLADRRGIDLDRLVILRGDMNALENGQERAEELFPHMQLAGTIEHRATVPTQTATGTTEQPAAEAPKKGRPITKTALMGLQLQAAALKYDADDISELLTSWECNRFEDLTDQQATEVASYLTERSAAMQQGENEETPIQPETVGN